MPEPTDHVCPKCQSQSFATRRITEGEFWLDEFRCLSCDYYFAARNNTEMKPADPTTPL